MIHYSVMKFYTFSEKLEKLEQTDSRLEMMYQLADLYQLLEEKEVIQASYLMQGSLVPQYLSLEFQLSAKMVVRSLAHLASKHKLDLGSKKGVNTTNTSKNLSLFEGDTTTELTLQQEITKIYKNLGDIGNVAQLIVARVEQKLGADLSTGPDINNVFDKLKTIALESGSGSQDRKIMGLVELFENLDSLSVRYVARIIIGKLRLGFSTMTILDALSWAILGSKNHRKILENAYQKRADVGELAKTYLHLGRSRLSSISDKSEKITLESDQDLLGQDLLKKYSVSVGIPVVPALCQRLNTSQEIIDKMGEVLAEPKYDGLRVQIHYSKKGFDSELKVGIQTLDVGTTLLTDKIRAFTRSLEEVTHMFPELSEVADKLNCDSCILDAEAIGYDPDTGKLLAFQKTITRKRKHKIDKTAESVPIRFYVFDCLYLNGEPLISEKLSNRKDALRGIFEDNQTIKFAETILTSDPEKLRQFHNAQLGDGLEGAVIKKIDSPYQSGRKGWSWVKIKEAEGARGKLKDTLDLVVMGYYFGRGKRSQFGVGAFLAGILDDDQQIKTIAKIGTGLSDDQFRELKQRADKLSIEKPPENYEVEKSLIPDAWTRPELVVEIAADEITKSPTHSAGVALRFPRLIKFRDDKNWTDATNLSELTGLG
jgi:DNA ligase 1